MSAFIGKTTVLRSQNMAAVKSKGNKSTELLFVRWLRRKRISGWRRHPKIFGKPDIFFPKLKVVVFLDGCFWHGCSRCYRAPSSNVEYWSTKILRNKDRDKSVSRFLRAKGWNVFRIWECDILRERKLARFAEMFTKNGIQILHYAK